MVRRVSDTPFDYDWAGEAWCRRSIVQGCRLSSDGLAAWMASGGESTPLPPFRKEATLEWLKRGWYNGDKVDSGSKHWQHVVEARCGTVDAQHAVEELALYRKATVERRKAEAAAQQERDQEAAKVNAALVEAKKAEIQSRQEQARKAALWAVFAEKQAQERKLSEARYLALRKRDAEARFERMRHLHPDIFYAVMDAPDDVLRSFCSDSSFWSVNALRVRVAGGSRSIPAEDWRFLLGYIVEVRQQKKSPVT